MPDLFGGAANALAVAVSGQPAPSGTLGISNASAFTFTPDGGARLDLSGTLLSWSDRIGLRLATHQYLKRDGAEVEPMGAEPGRFTMRLCFLGPSWSSQYRAFVGAIRANPRGQMSHPLLGNIRVACEGVSDASVVPAIERDSVNLTVSFVEDSIAATQVSERFIGPAAQAARTTDSANRLTSAIGKYAAAASAVATFTGYAITFAAAASQALGSSAPDPSLDQRLLNVGVSADAAIAAIRADPGGTTDASKYAAIQLVQQTYAAAIALMAAIAATRPALIVYVVPADTNIATLAATLYGREALARIDEILTLNRIPNPQLIPAGTVLRLSTPTL